ncbi:MAG: TetR/AcrR family transcriptional repressor of nem operon [Oceanicoccus sp.]|jgi:TetR/AcrR family transcriptional repressor of nem operon
MANTNKFNRDNVLHKASQLFWSKGFAGTSIRDIQDTVNMRPGSIYATFGSKEGLYKESLLSYVQSMGRKLDTFIEKANSPIEGLQQYVEYNIIEGASCHPSGICMLYKASGEFNGQNPVLFEYSQALINSFEKKVTHVFADAKQAGFIANDFDEVNAGQQFIILFTGLRNYFNGHNQPELAKKLIDKMFTQLQTQ